MSRAKLLLPTLGIVASLSARPVAAQASADSLDVRSAAFVRQPYLDVMDTVHVKLIALARAIPADKYDWRPGAGVRSVSGKYKPWGVTLVEAAFNMTDDQHEHLGQLIAYARAVGVKPPWSK